MERDEGFPGQFEKLEILHFGHRTASPVMKGPVFLFDVGGK
jgi:hypothetical protein